MRFNQWQLRQQDPIDSKNHSSEGSDFFSAAPHLVRAFLFNRGLLRRFESTEAFEEWLMPPLKNLQDPFKILDMKKSVERFAEAFAHQEKICIYADFDLDGTSGLALMADGLQQLGYSEVIQYQPKRLSEGYGFHASVVDEMKEQGVSLILTVDVGITAFEAVDRAKEIGMDVIITDHHQPSDQLPNAFTVVNPNRREDLSGLGYLCGAGVAFYFLRALKRELVDRSLIDSKRLDLKSLLDCFTIGTLTDMVPLIEDNRTLVKWGLKVLENSQRHGLRALLDELDLNKRSLTAQDVAIRFAPKLNALSRMELGVRPIDIFQAPTRARATELMATVFSNNATRVSLQEEGEREAQKFWMEWPHRDFFLAVSEKFHRGVVGLIATKIVGDKNVPTFIGSLSADGSVTGSARMPQGRNDSLLDAMASAGHFFNRFGGHDMAAGFEFDHLKKDQIIEGLKSHYSQIDPASAKVLAFDVEAKLQEVDSQLMDWLEKLGPFGQGFEIPIFRLNELRVDSVNILKAKHLKIRVGQVGAKSSLDLLLFSAPTRLLKEPPQVGQRIDVLGEIQWNYFSGKKSLQLLVKDLRISDSSESQSSPLN